MGNNTDKHPEYLRDLTIEQRPLADLMQSRRNARIHSKKQIRQVADSIKENGFVNPIIITPDGRIIAGHCRYAAAKLLGMHEVPTICIDHLNESQVRAYMIADNRLAELAGWDKEILKIEFQELITLDPGFDITITGFEMPEIDLMIQGTAPEVDPADEIPEIEENTPAISQMGDVWNLGKHKLSCNDACKQESYEKLIGNLQASMVFTDPPYTCNGTRLQMGNHRD